MSATRLANLREKFNEAKDEKVRLETRLEMAKKNKAAAVDSIKAAGYEPKKLKGEISAKEAELDKVLDELEATLPSDDFDIDDDEE